MGLAGGFAFEPLLRVMLVLLLLADLVCELRITRDVLAEPVVDGAVLGLSDLLVTHGPCVPDSGGGQSEAPPPGSCTRHRLTPRERGRVTVLGQHHDHGRFAGAMTTTLADVSALTERSTERLAALDA